MATILVVEVTARILIGVDIGPTEYWSESAGHKYEWYRREFARQSPDVLIIGDSSAATNFSPIAMEEVLANRSVFNLGTAGNFPLALRESTFPLLASGPVPTIVILSAFVGSYHESPNAKRLESIILNSRAVRVLNNRPALSDRIAIARLYPLRQLLVDRWLRRKAIVVEPVLKGFTPDDRLSDEIAAREVRRRELNESVAEQPSPERLQVILSLAELARERGFKLIVTLPDQRDAESQKMIARHLAWLDARSRDNGFAVIDLRDIGSLNDADFNDILHLTREGAIKQSRALAQCLAADWHTDTRLICK